MRAKKPKVVKRTKSVRLTPEEESALAKICQEAGLSEAALLQRWIRQSMYQYHLNQAVELVRDGGRSLSQAAVSAGVTMSDLIEELERRHVSWSHGAEQLVSGLEALAGIQQDQELLDILAEAQRDWEQREAS